MLPIETILKKEHDTYHLPAMRWILCLPTHTWTHIHTYTFTQAYLVNLCLWHWLKKQRALCNHSYIKWSHNQLHIVCWSIKLHPPALSCRFVIEGGASIWKNGVCNRLCLCWEPLDWLSSVVFFPPFVPLKRFLKMFKFLYRSSCQLHIKGASLMLRGFQKALCLPVSSWDSSQKEEEVETALYITPHWDTAALADRFTLVWGHLFLRGSWLKMIKRESG